MSVLIQVYNASKSFGAKTLFENAQFAVNEKEHVGVIGPNGAGKSTLFKCLVGDLSLDEGEITKSQKLQIGYLKQEMEIKEDQSVEDFIETGTTLPLWDLKRLAIDLGIQNKDFSRPIKDLSGGYRMRCQLLNILGREPNLLLLDEPTNYLDLESLLVLEKFLIHFKGAFMLISHDREFLKRTCDHTLEIENGDFTKFNGNIEDYFDQKLLIQEQLKKQALSQQAQRQEILKLAAKFGAKASKAKMVQSRLKRLDKMEHIEVKSLPMKARIQLPAPRSTGKNHILCIDTKLGYEDHTVLNEFSLRILSGDHIGVVGVNGAGKSTLLKALAGELCPLKGDIKIGHNVDIGFYAQHVAEVLDPKDTIMSALAFVAPQETTLQEIRDLAGHFLFSNDDVEKKIGILSGGEKARVALAQILLKKSPCLVLDEPTNHLDFHTVENLTEALKTYPGTIITVSHDRSFIQRVATKIIEIRDGHLDFYPGTYEEYVWSIEKGNWNSSRTSNHEDKKTVPSGSELKPKFNRKTVERDLKQQLKTQNQIDASLKKYQKQLDEINLLLPKATGAEANEAIQKLNKCQASIDNLESQWLLVQQKIEEIENILNSSTEKGLK